MSSHPENSSPLQFLPYEPLPIDVDIGSATFTPPPLDGSMRIAEMVDWNAKHSPNHPVFEYSDDSGAVIAINWQEAYKAVHRTGRYMRDIAGARALNASRIPVFAVLAAADTVTYATILLGVQRAGFTPFAVSPRNSATAVAHLLTKTQADVVLVGPEPAMQDLAAAAFEIMRSADTPLPHQASLPLFHEIYLDVAVPFEPLPPTKWSLNDPGIILHSSGSTAFPKPVAWTNYTLINIGRLPYYQDQCMTGMRVGCHNLAMFHGMGVVQSSSSVTAGSVMTALKPSFPVPAPTPETTLRGVEATKTDVIICVPSFIEEWSRDSSAMASLQKTKGVIYGGSPLAKEAGDKLASAGVPIYTMYGATEYGIIGTILPKSPLEDWEYLRIDPFVKHHLVPQDDGTVQLVLLACPFQTPSIVNTAVEGIPGFDTNDILMPHPTEKGWYKMYGRADDQIMHNTGEKTNPGPLEDILNQDPHVRAAVIFGRGKFNCGVIIDPTPEEAFDPVDLDKLVAFRNKIWPSVEKLNAYAPQHSRVFKEMITVASPSKPFTYTAKRTARRAAIINDYAEEIEALYAAADESTQADIRPPTSWTYPNAKEFVQSVITRVLGHDVGDDDDIFQNGCDSLEATWIRNSILHALRDTTDVNTRAVPGNFVYQHPTIASLARFVTGLVGSDGAKDSNSERAVASMHELVDKYTRNLPKHTPTKPAPASDVVLVTGTTGSLGCSLLALLSEMPEVSRVYAVNRKSPVPLAERQCASLQERGYDAEAIMASPKLVLLETAVEEERIGLPEGLYEELCTSVTHIIHNAWPVNFNLSLRSFEPSVRGVRHLIELSLASPYPTPAHIVFVSSIGIFRNIDFSKPIPEKPVDATVPVGTGYSESKWVSESILAKAAESTGLSGVSVRVGQITGSKSGAWNPAEWFPALVKSSIYLGCIPEMENTAAWLSADDIARALIEMRTAPSCKLHLVHPSPTRWSTVCSPIAEEFGLERVPYTTWLARLEKSGRGLNAEAEVVMMRRNPALKILQFFRDGRSSAKATGKHDGEVPEAMGLPHLDVTEAKQAAPSLRTLPPLSQSDVRGWLKFWKSVGHIA